MVRSSGTNVSERSPINEEDLPVSREMQKRRYGLSESGTSCDVDNDECLFYYIPPFIWEQILLRLPFKSIFRMRCVCKLWLSLTLSPSFVRSHCLLVQQRLSCFALNPPWTLLYSYTCGQQFASIPEERKLSHLCSSDHKSPQFSVLLSSARRQFDILAENAGLLLLHRSQMKVVGNYFVCNPFTKQLVALPPMPHIPWSTTKGCPGLIAMVQGYSITRYKVVVPICSNKEGVVPAGNFRFFIFCSQHGTWMDEVPILNSPILLEGLYFSAPVSHNESIYWPSYCRGLLLVYQSIENNGEYRAHIIKLPMIYPDQNAISICGSSGRHLRYMEVSTMYSRFMMEVWELEDSNSGTWSMKHRSDWSELWSEDEYLCEKLVESSRSPKNMQLVPVAFHPFDPDVVYLHNRKCIVSYNLQSRRLDTVCDPRPEFLGICWWDMMPFILPFWPTSIP